MKVVVLGCSVRNVAKSAFNAGLKVHAFTDFLDKDLMLYAEVERFRDVERVNEVADDKDTYVILSSGYENVRIKGERFQEVNRKILDKLKLCKRLESLGIDFPEVLRENDDGLKVVKRRFGGGGLGVRFYDGKVNRDEFVQRFVEGKPFSIVSLVRDGKILFQASNLILSGCEWLNARGFKYCGNLTPFKAPKEAFEIAKEIIEVFDLDGCVGVDFVMAEKPYVLEVNQRFVGSMDTIEMSYDVNLFKVLLKGKRVYRKPRRVALRCIYYAGRDVLVGNVPLRSYFSDIPQPGFYRKGSPLISVLASGSNVFDKVRLRLREFLTRLQKT